MTRFLPVLIRRSACALALALPLFVAAEALVKPLPTPDESKLSAEAKKELDDARAAFDKVKVNLVGDDLAAAYALAGAAYARAGFNDVAAIAFYDASQLAPKDGRWMYLRGVIARELKQTADARADFEAALAIDQLYLPIRMRLADTLEAQGDLDGARKLLEAGLEKFKNQSSLFAMLGRMEVKQKRYDAAIQHLSEALKLEPTALAINADLAAAYTGKGDTAAAQAAQAKAGPGQPSLADPLVAGIYQHGPSLHGTPLEQAKQLVAAAQLGPAREKTDEALKANPDDVEALALAARLDALLGKKELAQNEIGRALKLKPDSATANLSQGVVYEFAGDDAAAYAAYQKSARLDAKVADVQLLLAHAEMRRGHPTEALEHYRQLAALTSETPELTASMVAAQVTAGHCADALAHVNELLAKRSQDGDLMQIFVRLASTCPAAKPQERSMALDYGAALYKQRPNAAFSSALALAEAANGKFDEAQKFQAKAIYEAVRVGNKELADMYRTTMKQFDAKQVPDKPWPADHPYFKPGRLVSADAAPDK